MTTTSQPVPKPELLDPNRTLTNERGNMTLEEHRDRARLLESALHESCEYAQQLWEQLDTLRGYLATSLPTPGTDGGAAPRGPQDAAGWAAWTEAYARITSVLAGPHGDSGFGLDEARQLARARTEFRDGMVPTQETIEALPAEEQEHSRPASVPAQKASAGYAASLAAGLLLGRLVGRRRRAPGRAGRADGSGG